MNKGYFVSFEKEENDSNTVRITVRKDQYYSKQIIYANADFSDEHINAAIKNSIDEIEHIMKFDSKKKFSILVQCGRAYEAAYECRCVAIDLTKRGYVVKRSMFDLSTRHVHVNFIRKETRTEGLRYDLVYGFGKEASLFLTGGKSERPTLPLLEQIIKIEEEHRNV